MEGSAAFSRVLDFVAKIPLRGSGFREFLCLLYDSPSPACAESILDSLTQIITQTSPNEFFVLNGGKQAGIAVGVLPNNNVPSAGYGFFGWIRLERRDQTVGESPLMMTVYKLSAHKDCDIELYIKDQVLYYSVSVLSAFHPSRYLMDLRRECEKRCVWDRKGSRKIAGTSWNCTI